MSVPVRELRNNSAALLKRVQQGESVVVTKDGEPVAQVIPLRKTPLRRERLLHRWAALPTIDAEQFQRDVDDMLDWSL
uniref:type II toxin-antitoxin system Phd/YefM family antitoxin n=1 Tax=Tessaracoccus timonensis TaxID=2161816 RepID=UPI000D54B18B|nr:type II toxin-antitoxin system prevent-host-death family antitoxin [Tessaracoccus timonensis]